MEHIEYINLVSRNPLPEMITEVKNKAGELQYCFIKKSVIQRELREIFVGHTRWEMLRETVLPKGMYGVGRLEYKHPVSGDWLSVTGTASLPNDKKMRLGFPSLESHCMLNAVKKIGPWFGQNLNMDIEDKMPDEVPFEEEPTKEEQEASLREMVAFCKTEEELKSYRMVVYAKGTAPEIQTMYETKLRSFKNSQK